MDNFRFRHKKFRHVIKAAGLHDKELAKMLGLYWTTVNRWTNPKYGYAPSTVQLLQCLEHCGYTPAELAEVKISDFYFIDGVDLGFASGIPERFLTISEEYENSLPEPLKKFNRDFEQQDQADQ